MDAQLNEALAAMKKAGKVAMRQELPRNLDAPWREVTMRYTEEFVARHYEQLQAAFQAGLSEGP